MGAGQRQGKGFRLVLTFFLNLCYILFTVCMTPVILWKRVRTGKYRSGWRQKFWGTLPERKDESRPLIWLHAVSVGEVLQLRQIIAGLRTAISGVQILVTTTTETGHSVAREKLSDCEVAFFPLDFSWSVRRALTRVQPDLIVLVELELWPNLVRMAARRRIPLALINGRLSARSFRGYHRIRILFQKLLQRFSLIAVQADEYRERFLALGANPETTIVTGSIKFDGVTSDRTHPLTLGLREWMLLQPNEMVLVAGSTQDPEELMVLEIFEQLRHRFEHLRLIIVPRHPERGNDLARQIRHRGHAIVQRSCSLSFPLPESPPVGLLDTVGELGACWGLADVAFVGGSFTNRGGQNMLEPAAYGAAVCYGPNTWNFRQVVELLEQHQASVTVHSSDELQSFVEMMLTNRDQALEQGRRAQEFVLSQQGATEKTVRLVAVTLAGNLTAI